MGQCPCVDERVVLERRIAAMVGHRARLASELLAATRADLSRQLEEARFEIGWRRDQQAQTQQELAEALQQLADARFELTAGRAQWAAELAALHGSASWRLTAPLRRVSEALRGRSSGSDAAAPADPEPAVALDGIPCDTLAEGGALPADEMPAAIEPASEPPVPPMDRIAPPALGAAAGALRVAVVVHVYYIDLLDEIVACLGHLPGRFALLASVTTEAAADSLRRAVAILPNLDRLEVRLVPNRGRDIGPLFAAFGGELAAFDVICHIHTKKSLQLGHEAVGWRRHLFDSLLGSTERIATVLEAFAADPGLGLVYPGAWSGLAPWAFTWLSNRAIGRSLLDRLGLDGPLDDYLDYPVGSMFWARPAALGPLLRLGLQFEDFPTETGQTDGALQHAIERSFVIVAESAGFSAKVAEPGSGPLRAVDDRNFSTYLVRPTAERIAAIDPRVNVFCFAIFETLLLRPFTDPAARRAYLAWTIAREFGVADFASLREAAEAAAVADTGGGPVGLAAIHAVLARLAGLPRSTAEAVLRREIDVETRIALPRTPIIEAAWDLKRRGRRIALVADTPVDRPQVEATLFGHGIGFYDALYLSSDHGRGRASGLWDDVLAGEAVAHDLIAVIGDDERLDLQASSERRFRDSLQVMRPLAFARYALAPRDAGAAP